MGYADILRDAVDALQFEESGVRQLQNNVDSATFGVVTVLLSGLASAIGTINPFGLLIYPILSLLGVTIGVAAYHLFAKLLGGEGSFKDLFSVLSNGQVILWISVIPILGPLLGFLATLYYLAFSVFAIKTVYDLSVVKSVFVLLLPTIIIGVLVAIFMIVVVGTLLSTAGLGLAGALSA